jgi:hypothetical protein
VTTPALDLFDDGDLSGPAAETVRRIAVTGFRALWSGRTVTLAELVDGDAAVLTEAADHLRARGRIELSADGQIVAVHGLARRSTRHRIAHDGGGHEVSEQFTRGGKEAPDTSVPPPD